MTMQGFKSFAKHTELLFGNGFNCVLGPNGSGKSNIIDALCFVLGRMSAKSLRAEKASNLIYNGGKSKNPASQGEVSIFFDNSKKTFPSEEPYIKITRIIRKDGQSIYKINDEKRTRQQVLDLLAIARIDPDGYNIVLQGDIIHFADMNSVERRMIIEEVSGISVYEDKKQKALKELERVDEKLKEADILLTERNTYLKELKKERDQAQKFKDLKDRIDVSKASYLWMKIEAKQKIKDEIQAEINKNQDKLNSINQEISSLKADIENKKNEISAINNEIETKGEKEQVAMQQEVEKLKIDIATNKTRVDNLKAELEKISMRKKQLNDDLKSLDSDIQNLSKEKSDLEKKKSNISKEIARLESEIKKFRKDNQIDNAAEIEKEIEALDKEAEEKQKEIDELRKEQQDCLRQKDAIEFQLNSMQQKIDKVLELEKQHKEQIEELKKKKNDFKKVILDLNILLNQDSILARQIADDRKKLNEIEQELAKLNARNISIRESAGDIAVKKIIEQKNKNKIRGIYGTVSELGSVNSKYSLALEIAAGPRINSIVVEDDKIARDCIHYLKENKFGVAVFLPLNKIKAKQQSEDVDKLLKEPGVHGRAVELVEFDPKFKRVFEYVFQDTIVVEDIDTARKIGIGKARMVTLDGDLAELSGAMQGGYRERKNRAGFQENEVVKGIEEFSAKAEKLRKEIADIESKREANEKIINELREKKASLEGEIIKEEKSLHLDNSDLDSSKKARQELEQKSKEINKKTEEVSKKISEFNKILTTAKIKKQELRQKISELRNPALLAELNAFEQKKDELSKEIVQVDADIRTIATRINDMLIPEKAKIQEIIKQQQKDTEAFDNELKNLNEKIKNDSIILKEKEKNLIAFRAQHKELFAKR
ncbi:MAG: AAA family ATPase, partial [Candidatus Pacearchaeota archaeon]